MIEQSKDGPTVYMFGFRNRLVAGAPLPNALRWLCGEDLPVDAALATEIRQEFARLEQYRRAMLDALQKAQSAILQKAADNVPMLEGPAADMVEAYWSGYGCGQYGAYSEAAAELSEVSAVAALEGVK